MRRPAKREQLARELAVVELGDDESAKELRASRETLGRMYMKLAAPSVGPAARLNRMPRARLVARRAQSYIDVMDVNGDIRGRGHDI